MYRDYSKHQIKLPRTFIEDHFWRELDTGLHPHWIGKFAHLQCDDLALDEIESDARFYAGADGPDMCQPDIIASAKRVVAAIEKYRAKQSRDRAVDEMIARNDRERTY